MNNKLSKEDLPNYDNKAKISRFTAEHLENVGNDTMNSILDLSHDIIQF